MFDENNAGAEWSKCTFFAKEIEWLGFQLSNEGTIEQKIDCIDKMKQS